jgi:hypothetical protein
METTNMPTQDQPKTAGAGQNRAEIKDQWALVAWPKNSGEEYRLLTGRYETLAGAKLAADISARTYDRTVQVVKEARIAFESDIAAERKLFSLFRDAADCCFDDIKATGNISQTNAQLYRKLHSQLQEIA